jgi:hypothetical protein
MVSRHVFNVVERFLEDLIELTEADLPTLFVYLSLVWSGVCFSF